VADRLNDPARLEAIAASGLVDAVEFEALNRISRLAAYATGAPLALVNVVGAAQHATVAGVSRIERFGTSGVVSLERSFCRHVVIDEAPLVVDDARAHPLLADNPSVTEDGVVTYLGVPLRGPDGEVLGALCAVDEQPREWTDGDRAAMDDLAAMITDELALRQSSKEIETLARRDPLTGLGNRRLWDEQAAVELSRSRRDGTPLSVALFDLDGFKAVNDAKGHAAGDDLLRVLAALWTPLVRLPDVLVRLGGDEFAALLPGSDGPGAAVVADRLAASLPDGIGVSYGTAQWIAAETFDELVARADHELYTRKRER